MQSWVAGADDASGFGLAHLPYGVFRAEDGARPCVRIGDRLLDLSGAGLLNGLSPAIVRACQSETLNALMSLGSKAWSELRTRLATLLREESSRGVVEPHLHAVANAELLYPLATRGYVDFYASIDHARRVGELFRPENPLLPNYKHVPIGYNGRASSLVVSGTEVRRPWGQQRPRAEGDAPVFAPTAALDYELELAMIVAHGNVHGEPIMMGDARSHLFGVALLNDWSARDVQAWEYQPLGPFLGKSFATSVSPWITPLAALEPYRVEAAERDAPLAYLSHAEDRAAGALDITVEAWLKVGGETVQISSGNVRDLFWTPAQMLTHAASNGCPLETGDVLATGTLSGASLSSAGCLMELTRNGAAPLTLANGVQRTSLKDGDEVILRARCKREGLPTLVLGECTGKVLAAHGDILPR